MAAEGTDQGTLHAVESTPTVDIEPKATRYTYAGLFMVTLATLMYEILLTRIFSVTIWYHYAYMAISIALFGMTAGAVLVFLFPGSFTRDRVKAHLGLSSLMFSVAIVLSFVTHLRIPFATGSSLSFLSSIVSNYALVAVPFVFSGICVSLALTRFPRQVGKLYAADLAGSAVGGVLLISTLKITDGPTAVIVVALLAGIAAASFTADTRHGNLFRAALTVSILLAALAAILTVLAWNQAPVLRLFWVKGEIEDPPLYEKWNSFSRIRVERGPLARPRGWGLSPRYRVNRRVEQLYMNIDASAGTILTKFTDNLSILDYLKYDITNLAHYLRSRGTVLVVGSGGGRDILSALVFDQGRIVAVEINEEINRVVNRRFGDFTGHLDQNPKVVFVTDEARSYIVRQKEKFDIIQVSFADTWAATAAGAFTHSESSLYTVEAWRAFLEHLNPRGVLTVSRWYLRDMPGEMYRLTSLAAATLIDIGVGNPRNHIIIVRRMRNPGERGPDGVGTMLVGREPFSLRDLDTIERVAREMDFEIVLGPRVSLDPVFERISRGRDIARFVTAFPINLAAPTDDSPFFFHMLRFRDAFKRTPWAQGTSALHVLATLLVVVMVLTFLCIILPMFLTTERVAFRRAWRLSIFFASIGLGFMFVEVSQMQRLIIFLGHPTYSLSVVLFTLLLSSGLGSYSTHGMSPGSSTASSLLRLLLLSFTLGLFGVFSPRAISAFQASETPLRILVAVSTLFAPGFFMGMAFPLGMREASSKVPSLGPWLWGVNGATSVCASVLAVVMAMSFSISASFWAGFACYLVAFAAFLRESATNVPSGNQRLWG